jgi:hypothetical protein
MKKLAVVVAATALLSAGATAQQGAQPAGAQAPAAAPKMATAHPSTKAGSAQAAKPVLALAPAADAADQYQVKSDAETLGLTCSSLGGDLTFSNDGTFAICDFDGGSIVCDFDQDELSGSEADANCTVDVEKKAGSLVRAIPELNVQGELSTHFVPRSRVWRQKVSVAGLRDIVCNGLGGEFVASDDGSFGACATANATFACNDEEHGKNCKGVADKKKYAVFLRKAIRVLLKSSSVSPAAGTDRGGSTTSTTETTSPSSTTTTVPPTTTTTTGPAFL